MVIKNSKQADFLLIDTYSTTNFYYAFIISQLSRLLKIKYIPILHGGNLERRLLKNPIMSKMLFENAYRLVSPSYFLKNNFIDYGYNNIQYIPNIIEINNYDFVNRPISDINLLWVRSFNKIYNPTLAIHVVKELINRNEKVKLTMVGPKSDESFSEAQTMAMTQQLDVNFTGKLSKKEWIDLSKESNVFINTTNFDNAPVSVIEAMALGLPVVSTNVGGLPFLISHNEDGLLVPPDDVNAMTNAILSLKDDSNLKHKIVLNARNKVEQFDWNNVKAKWKALLS
ncbi:glycosyltransferase family 4 protein [Winogradskyella aquimaris]|nr:glycosyltransferase family 4 protein [Winogradskyella aquimaris]